MGKIYVNQTQLKIKLNVGVDISGARTLLIKYIKPDGVTKGQWTGYADPTALQTVDYDFSVGDLDVSGSWIVWAYVTFSDGKSAPGAPVKLRVWDEGT